MTQIAYFPLFIHTNQLSIENDITDTTAGIAASFWINKKKRRCK